MLKRKMLRDVSNYKVQFISIFLMAFIGVFVFTGMYVETSSFETTIDNYYGETNLTDGWIYSNYLVDEFLHQVYLLGATTQMDRQLVVNSHAQLENSPDIILHFMSFMEMEREISTLRVLGFKSIYLSKLLLTQSLLFIIMGFLLGIPVGYYVLSILVPAFGKDLYFLPSISTANLAFTFAIMMAVSIFVNLLFSRKIKKLDMVESLNELE